MRKAYRVLAFAIPVLVVVQAMAIAFALFGLSKWVEDGHSLTKSAMESENVDFTGSAGFMIHGIFGEMLIPLVAIALLVVSFFTKVPGASKWAAYVLVAVVVHLGGPRVHTRDRRPPGRPALGPVPLADVERLTHGKHERQRRGRQTSVHARGAEVDVVGDHGGDVRRQRPHARHVTGDPLRNPPSRRIVG